MASHPEGEGKDSTTAINRERKKDRVFGGEADAVPAGFLFNGALSTCEQLGFTKDRLIGKHRWGGQPFGRVEKGKVVTLRARHLAHRNPAPEYC